jgi:CRISPR-associated protein Cas8a1/Csx13
MGAVTEPDSNVGGLLRIGLFDPGLGTMHRVGLAGLYMTLEAIEQSDQVATTLHSTGGAWARDPHGVELSWSGDGQAFFRTLLRESFKLTPDGRFWFPGLGDPRDFGDEGVTLQDALLNTFLQHGKTRKADPSTSPRGTVVLPVDRQGRTLGFVYRRVAEYAHQTADFDPWGPNRVVGWQFPGGAVRHTAFTTDTELVEPPGAWLALLYAPVGGLYFRVATRTGAVRPQFCIVLPEITDLAAYARARRRFSSRHVQDDVVAGAGDAGLRALAELQRAGVLDRYGRHGVTGCQVMAFGVAPWASQQKTRADVYSVPRIGEAELVFFERMRLLSPAIARERRATPGATAESSEPGAFWLTSPVVDLVARNLVSGRPWWLGFTGVLAGVESREQLRIYLGAQRIETANDPNPRRGGLAEMVNAPNAFLDRGAEVIVRACHEAWRRRLGKLGERARREGLRAGDLFEREFERARVDFVGCKNAASLRTALTDFWARAGGPIKELQEGWRDVLPFLSEDSWQMARDLALLALVSYAAVPGDQSSDDHQSSAAPPDDSGD